MPNLIGGGLTFSQLGHLTRYGSNPVLTNGSVGAWDSVDVANPDVKWDAANSRWVMNYSGYDGTKWHTGLAYSTNLTSWSKEAANPVLSPTEAEGYIAANGSIVSVGSSYFLYYQVQPPSAIYLATSTNLTSWSRIGAVLSTGAAGQWDESAVFDPYARLLSDGTVQIFYAGYNSASARGIGAATSADGIAFAKTGRLVTAMLGEVSSNMGEPSAVGDDTNYVLFHDGATVSGDRFLDAAWTTDGANFSPRLRDYYGPASGWESAQVFDSSPVVSNGTLYLFYAGATVAGVAENLNAQIGLATAPWPPTILVP